MKKNNSVNDAIRFESQSSGKSSSSRIPLPVKSIFASSNKCESVSPFALSPQRAAFHIFPHSPPLIASPRKNTSKKSWFFKSNGVSSTDCGPCKKDDDFTKQVLEICIEDALHTCNRNDCDDSHSDGSCATPSPQEYLESMLKERGYSIQTYDTLQTAYYNKPTPLQLASYGREILKIVKGEAISSNGKNKQTTDNVQLLEEMLQAGLSPNACNKSGVSLVHRVCRLGNFEMLQVMMDYGCTVQISDDSGRTPLHNICYCWTSKDNNFEPSFDAVGMLLEIDVHMLFLKDRLGLMPLQYTSKKHWNRWIQFLDSKKTEFWPKRSTVLHGEQKHPPLAVLQPNTKPIKDPANALPLKLASRVANGFMEAKEADRIRCRQLERKLAQKNSLDKQKRGKNVMSKGLGSTDDLNGFPEDDFSHLHDDDDLSSFYVDSVTYNQENEKFLLEYQLGFEEEDTTTCYDDLYDLQQQLRLQQSSSCEESNAILEDSLSNFFVKDGAKAA